MTDHKELIERLRLVASISDEVKLNRGYTAVTDEAADALEALQLQLDYRQDRLDKVTNLAKELRAEVSKWMALTEGNIKLNEHLTARLTALEGHTNG